MTSAIAKRICANFRRFLSLSFLVRLGVRWCGSVSLKVSVLLDAVVADVGDDDVAVVHDREAGRSLKLAAVGVDGGVEGAAVQLKHLKIGKKI